MDFPPSTVFFPFKSREVLHFNLFSVSYASVTLTPPPFQNTGLLKTIYWWPYLSESSSRPGKVHLGSPSIADLEERSLANAEMIHTSFHCPIFLPKSPVYTQITVEKRAKVKISCNTVWFVKWLIQCKAPAGFSCRNSEFWGGTGEYSLVLKPWVWYKQSSSPWDPTPEDTDFASSCVQDSLGSVGCKQLRLPNFLCSPNW